MTETPEHLAWREECRVVDRERKAWAAARSAAPLSYYWSYFVAGDYCPSADDAAAKLYPYPPEPAEPRPRREVPYGGWVYRLGRNPADIETRRSGNESWSYFGKTDFVRALAALLEEETPK